MEGDLIFAQKLTEKGIRPSIQRIAIYKFLYENHIHPTVDTVFKSLYPLYPTLSRTTVYNTLHLFVLQNLVQTVKIEDEEVRYDATLTPHAHFKCNSCGKVFDVINDEITASLQKSSDSLPHDFKITHAEINFWGLCSECSKATDCQAKKEPF